VDLTSRRDESAIDWRQVRLLLATNWRTKFNRASRSPVRSAFGVLLLSGFAFAAVILSIALGIWVDSKKTSRPELAGAAVHQVFLTVFFIIVATPVLGFRGNEFLDVTKLFVYPVGHRTVFAATLAGLMASGAVLFLSLPVAATVIGYGGPPGTIAAGLVAGLVLVLVAVALGQLVLLAFLNTLKGRKWRDLTMVLVPLFFGGFWVTYQILLRRGSQGRSSLDGAVEWFAKWKDWTLPLPSWWAAHAVTGSGWTRFVPLVAALALVVWLVRASAVLQERAYFGEVAAEVAAEGVVRRGLLARIASRLRDPLGALVEKDLSILGREPAVKSILIGQSIYPVFGCGFGIYQLWTSTAHEGLGRYAPLAGLVSYPLLLMELGLVINLLGLEGGGAVHAMLLPVRRRLLLLGKDVAFLLVFGTLNAAVAIVATIVAFVVTRAGSVAACAQWSLLGALEGYCVLAVGLGIGNIVSVISPIRVAVRDRRAIRQQAGGREGCARSLVSLVAVFGSMALSLPIAALFHLPYGLGLIPQVGSAPGWAILVTVPVAVLLAAAVLLGGAVAGGRLLELREEDVVGRLTRSDE
jgi:hypothetical protein